MLNDVTIQSLDEFFVNLSKRNRRGVFCYRINGFNEEIKEFLVKYYQEARRTGVVIEGRIPNPSEKHLFYYEEMMGMEFLLELSFIDKSLKKWLPRMKESQRSDVSKAIFETLNHLNGLGKNKNILRNIYIKFMCWLYYKFERILNQLGNDTLPKILYEGSISYYELLLIQVLAKAGCDVVLLQYQGDTNYLQLDANSEFSKEWKQTDMRAFPKEFNLQWIRNEIQEAFNNEKLYGRKPTIINSTNTWLKGTGLKEIGTELQLRGRESHLFYNAFLRINGVEDKVTYLQDCYQLYLKLKQQERRVVVVDEGLRPPTPEEIAQIKRSNYTKYEQVIMDLQSNIKYTANIELQRSMVKGFVEVLLEETKTAGMNVNKITNEAVYLLCWLRRYQEPLFSNWKQSEMSCFIYLGGCQNKKEALFLKFLARQPVDVLILNPNLNRKCVLTDQLLYEIHYPESLQVSQFPRENTRIQIGTAAYHAERELDGLLYQDSGIYRNQQYRKATSIQLQTMYEEIALLWNQEVKYRQNFQIHAECVQIPVIYAKVCGVKEENLMNYWSGIKKLLTEDTILIKQTPYLVSNAPNPMKAFATEFLKHGKLQRNKIKEHVKYPYRVLREEMQEHILDKLQLLIDQKIIKGTFENGTEYTIVSVILNLDKEIFRMIQKFDFTKINPKLIYLNTTEKHISLEDSIFIAFLHLLGFDIVFFVPTGYQTVETYFQKKLMDEHQIGSYLYDLKIPDFEKLPVTGRISWKDKIFRRGI